MKSEDNKNFDPFINELIHLVQHEENIYAFHLLKQRLKNWFDAITWKNIKKFPHTPLNFNHLNVYWELSLLRSVLLYDSWMNIPFCQFSIQQYNWFLLSYLRNFVKKKYISLNYSMIYDENDYFLTYKIYKKANLNKNSQSFFSENDCLKHLFEQKKCLGTDLEQTVLKLKLQGYHNWEIANLKKWNYRIVDNAWQRIKKKIFLKKDFYQW